MSKVGARLLSSEPNDTCITNMIELSYQCSDDKYQEYVSSSNTKYLGLYHECIITARIKLIVGGGGNYPKYVCDSAGNHSYKIKHLCMIIMYLRIVRSGFNRKVVIATYNLKNWGRALSFTLLPGLSMFPQLLLVWLTSLNRNMACPSNRHLQVKSLKLLGNYKKQSSLSWLVKEASHGKISTCKTKPPE